MTYLMLATEVRVQDVEACTATARDGFRMNFRFQVQAGSEAA